MAAGDVTELLNRWSNGEPEAFDALIPHVYQELKHIARHALAGESKAQTIDCTVLVHEAYLRLVDQTRMQWSGRAHFFGAAARAMRRVLVEHARQRLARKRGAGARHESLDCAVTLADEPDLDVIALNDALDELMKADPESARVVELRYFAGLSVEETADALGTSASTVARLWSFARAWLLRAMSSNQA